MKRSHLRHKAKKNTRAFVSLLLCLALTLCFYGASAQGAESGTPAGDTASEPVEIPGDEALQIEETNDPAGDAVSLPSESAGEEALQAGETEAPAESVPEEKQSRAMGAMLVITFRMGPFGQETVTVPKGEIPTAVPVIPELPAATVLGWYDEDGNPADPGSSPALHSTVYTARWGRKVNELLNTDDHKAYIAGHGNGTFRPDDGVTRAEAAQMLYSLLRVKAQAGHGFSDTAGQWFTPAVEAMAGLGVLSGYSDGSFQPNRQISRAEFVTMAVACDTLEAGSASFTDVPDAHWAAPYIKCAASKGWISGFGDGSFRPEAVITRAQAVTILNGMLGRIPNASVKSKTDVKNFYDLFTDYWAYGQIAEASTDHTYVRNGNAETWTGYTRDTKTETSRWVQEGGAKYYLDGKTRKYLRGEQTIGGKKYMLDSATGAAVTGFRMSGGWRRYFQAGQMMEDISSLGVVKGPYFIKVYKNSNYLILYAKDEKGNYNTPVRAMRVSCGYGTPTGTFYTPYRYRWLKMIGDTWAQWCTQIQGNYLFHSVPNWTYNNMDLEVGEYNHLGETRSMGCVRLNCRDAKWIFDNCALGTKVTITTQESGGPLSKPAGLWIPSWHTWDPTDPTAYWRCRQNGCH